jgi:uncharacterized protein (TIGR02145 family)
MKSVLKLAGLFLLILSINFVYACKKDKPEPPSITTTSVNAISTNAAVSGGNITDDGGETVVSKGVCWSTLENPIIDNNRTIETGGAASFTSNISQLSPSTTYYVRAYATNSAGTGYGNSITFKTLGNKPITAATNAIDITINSATIMGTVNANSLITTAIFEFGISTSYGSTSEALQSPVSADTDGAISITTSLAGLTPGTTYHFRIKTENSLGISYSDDFSFTTLGKAPTILSQTATNLQVNSAKINCSINPNYLTTNVSFEWGTTNSYGNSITTVQNPANGNAPVNLNADLSGLSEGTTYHFRTKATNESGTSTGEDSQFTTPGRPLLSTTSISKITTTSAITGGNIISDFGLPVTKRGICWSKTPNSSVSDNNIISEIQQENYSISITGLTANSTYYLRAFATNSLGTGYGDELILKTYTGTVTDIEGNAYYTVTIGSQIWMAENLKTTKFLNGDLIGTTSPSTLDVTNESTPKYQWAYNGDENNVSTYGRLYTWYAVTDPRLVCPTGWHVPEQNDIAILREFLGGYLTTGGTLKEGGVSHWLSPNIGATNETGFTALPGGYRTNSGYWVGLGTFGAWWTSTEDLYLDPYSDAYSYSIYNNSIVFGAGGGSNRKHALSVRCVKN